MLLLRDSLDDPASCRFFVEGFLVSLLRNQLSDLAPLTGGEPGTRQQILFAKAMRSVFTELFDDRDWAEFAVAGESVI